MKVIKKSLLVSLTLSALLISGCKKVEETAGKLIDDTKNSYNNAAKEVKKIKDKTMETVNDLEKASEKIKEATDAVKEVTD